MHVVTLRNKTRLGEIPAAKVGKRWLFLKVDLTDWLRSHYAARALQGDKPQEKQPCHSTNAKIVPFGGSSLPSTDDAYRKALGLKTEKPPRNTTTG